MVIGQHLDLDMSRVFNEFFEVDACISERRLGFVRGLLQCCFQREVIGGNAHSLSTAAGGCFDEHGKANLPGNFDGLFFIGDQTVAAGNDGNFGLSGHRPGGVFVTQFFHRVRRRANKVDVAVAANRIEVGIFCEKPISRMHGFDIADLGRTDDLVDPQITVD